MSEPSTAADMDETEEPQSRDQFEDVGVNPFVDPEHDPFSTFAADVDTASYDVFRQWMSSGRLPPAASVRLEEYVNYFHYDYPAPEVDSETPFEITLASAQHPLNEDIIYLRVGIQAVAPPSNERPRANLVFLIDVSGSMDSPEKLPLVQELLINAVNMLQRDDTISIVTYAGGTAVRLEPTRVSDSDRIIRAINSLEAGGGTAGAAGINLAYEQARDGFIEDGINQVILCTDGDFNIGPSGNEDLVDIIEERRRGGVTLTALGFGQGNLNDSMMEAVSNAGNGIYSVIYNEERAAEFIELHLLPSVVHVAKDMKIQIEFNPEHVAAYRLLGYVNRAIADEDFRDDAIDAGEVGAGHRVTALYEIVLPGRTVPTPSGAPDLDAGDPVEGTREIQSSQLVEVRVRYKNPGASEEDEAYETSDGLGVGTPVATFADADADFRWAVAVAMFAELVQETPFVGIEAIDVIEDVASAQAERDDQREEFASLVTAARSLIR
jgi:Ca-activated chloride channel family protein